MARPIIKIPLSNDNLEMGFNSLVTPAVSQNLRWILAAMAMYS